MSFIKNCNINKLFNNDIHKKSVEVKCLKMNIPKIKREIIPYMF